MFSTWWLNPHYEWDAARSSEVTRLTMLTTPLVLCTMFFNIIYIDISYNTCSLKNTMVHMINVIKCHYCIYTMVNVRSDLCLLSHQCRSSHPMSTYSWTNKILAGGLTNRTGKSQLIEVQVFSVSLKSQMFLPYILAEFNKTAETWGHEASWGRFLTIPVTESDVRS
jgi:hypothetical protein